MAGAASVTTGFGFPVGSKGLNSAFTEKIGGNMKRQKDFTLFNPIAFVLLLVVVAGSWVANAVKLSACDFESDYRCEFIHGSGLFFIPISVVTVWFGDDGA